MKPRDAATPGSSGRRTVIAAYCSYGTLSATETGWKPRDIGKLAIDPLDFVRRQLEQLGELGDDLAARRPAAAG